MVWKKYLFYVIDIKEATKLPTIWSVIFLKEREVNIKLKREKRKM